MKLSRVAGAIGESSTLKLNATAAAMRQRGEPVIHLGGGEPTSAPPREAIERCATFLHNEPIRYGPAGGIAPMKDAVVRYTKQFYDIDVTPKNVVISSGGKQALMVALQAVVDPGSEVIFPAPYWVSYPDMVRICGGEPVVVRPAAKTLCPTLAEIEARVTPRTAAIMINSPNNPSGVVYDEAFLADVVQFCQQRDIWLIMDDIYQRLVFDGATPFNCVKYATDFPENARLVVINGVSKQFAMTGFRIGWAVGPAKLIEAMTNIQGHQTSGPSTLLQHAALGALEAQDAGVAALVQALADGARTMLEEIAQLDGVTAPRPRGAFYCFPDFSKYEPDSIRLAERLLETVKVVAVPGIGFGMEGHLRLSTCGSQAQIREGMARIRWALDPSAPAKITIGKHTFER